MSTPQDIRVRMLAVDRETADVLRLEAKQVLVFNHELFEDLLEFGSQAQYALSMRFRDACALIDAVSWDPNDVDPTKTTFEVPLTYELVEQLRDRRFDLGATNIDLLDGVDEVDDDLLAEITVNRLAAGALDRLIGTYVIAVLS